MRGIAIALTGGIGCGKSAAGEIFAAEGAVVKDADVEARSALEPGQPAYDAVVARFGRDIVGGDGQVDRKRLAGVVFQDPVARKNLEDIVHPQVRSAMRAWRKATLAEGRDAVGIIPLLFEVGLAGEWDVVVCVSAVDDLARVRLAARGWSPAEIVARQAAQWPVQEKARRADYVIENNGTMEELADRVRRTYAQIRKRKKELDEHA